MSDIRVLLVDDHRMFREGLRSLIEDADDILVIGEASSAKDAFEFIEQKAPHVVLLDVSLPDESGLDAAETILRKSPATRVVLLSIHSIEAYIKRAESLGAAGYLGKDCTPDSVIAMIRRAASGEPFSAILAPDANHESLSRGRLTGRQIEVLKQIARGRKLNEIAKALHISVRTAERHRANIKDALDIHDAASLIRYAVRNGLVDEAAVDFSRVDTQE